MIAPKPPSRPDRVSLWQYLRLFRRDLLSAQPERLYAAKMAEFRTPFFQSYMLGEPELIRAVLQERPQDFPKSDRVAEGLRPLLGNSVFLTNGAVWARQRRIIDPAFEGGRLRDTFGAMVAAAEAAAQRASDGVCEVEELCSHAAADVIFRTLFSVPIEDARAQAVFHAFKAYQREQPIVNLAAFVPLPRWMPRGFSRRTRETARTIRALITEMCEARAAEIAAGTAPDDLATKIMTFADPETGARFSTEEMVDQVAIFFLAGHETSASALAWALYLLAEDSAVQERVAEEAQGYWAAPSFSGLSKLKVTRDVFRETLRLFPPVPMMVREATREERFRDRVVRRGAQLVVSPWHTHRNPRLWTTPDAFDPDRWSRAETKESQRAGYLPFSAGSRVCPGAGFAMAEGVLLLSALIAAFRVAPVSGRRPMPVAHLTVRAREGIWLDWAAR